MRRYVFWLSAVVLSLAIAFNSPRVALGSPSCPSSAEIISAVDPAYSGMLLGDAFYEQQLVQQQVTQMTGMA